MACSNCGYSGAYSVNSCPNCNPGKAPKYSVEDAERDRKAGAELGAGLVIGIGWLLSNRYLSYVWFWLVWFITAYVVGKKLGFVSEGWTNSSFGFDVFGAILPIALMIVFRKQIPKIMRWLWLGLAAGIVGFAVLSFMRDDEPAPQTARETPAVRAEAARNALNETANSGIRFIAPGSDNSSRVVFEGVDMSLCEIDDPGQAVCRRYCATLEVKGRPGWCN